MAFLLWITGLSGAGKTTIAREVLLKIKQKYPTTVLLDGDEYREITGKRTGYTKEERFRVAKEIAAICKFLTSQEVNVVCSTISLFKEIHEFNRKNFKDYYEVFVSCNMEELVRRDKKGIYSGSLKGEERHVVGVDIAYDHPTQNHLSVDNSTRDDLTKNVTMIIDGFYERKRP